MVTMAQREQHDDQMEIEMQRQEDVGAAVELMQPAIPASELVEIDRHPSSKARNSFIVEANFYAKKIHDQRRGVVSANTQGMVWWDLTMLILLVWATIFTPFEMAFLSPLPRSVGLTILNVMIDFFFLCDMVLQFFLVYRDVETGKWVYKNKDIAWHYLKGWFFPDLIATIPYDLMTLNTSSRETSFIKLLKFFKLFRLLKLLRLLRVSRIIKRWETSFGIRYSVLSLGSFLITAVTLSHWGACMFALAPILDANGFDGSWMAAYGLEGATVGTKYITSLYWSIMTLTTIGYGDIALGTDTERIIAILCMVVGGSLYAYIVGNICGTVAGMNLAQSDFRQTMDHLNAYLEEMKIDHDLRKHIRMYFMQCQARFQHVYYKKVVGYMSPGLQGQFAAHCHADWFKTIPFFTVGEDQAKFITDLVQRLKVLTFPAQETIVAAGELARCMYIVKKGLVASRGAILRTGNNFGSDFILEAARRDYSVLTLTFADVFMLRREDLDEVLMMGDYGDTENQIRDAAIRMSLRRGIIQYGKDVVEAPKLQPEEGHSDFRMEAHVLRLSESLLRVVYRYPVDMDKLEGEVHALLVSEDDHDEDIDLGAVFVGTSHTLSLPESLGNGYNTLLLLCDGAPFARCQFKSEDDVHDPRFDCSACKGPIKPNYAQQERDVINWYAAGNEATRREVEQLNEEVDKLMEQVGNKLGVSLD